MPGIATSDLMSRREFHKPVALAVKEAVPHDTERPDTQLCQSCEGLIYVSWCVGAEFVNLNSKRICCSARSAQKTLRAWIGWVCEIRNDFCRRQHLFQ